MIAEAVIDSTLILRKHFCLISCIIAMLHLLRALAHAALLYSSYTYLLAHLSTFLDLSALCMERPIIILHELPFAKSP